MFLRAQQASERITVAHEAITAPRILDIRASQGHLTGQLLVATPAITGGCFHKSVIYIFSHSVDGAMGVIVNQPLETLHFSALMGTEKLPDPLHTSHIQVYSGGPVERGRGFVLHSTDYHCSHALMQHNGIAITATSSILADIASGRGPAHFMLAVGYAGWVAGQLETEIAENSWLTVPATPELVFATNDELKWAMAGKSLGVTMELLSTAVGHA